MYALTQNDFAKGVLDKQATNIIERKNLMAEDVPMGLADTSDRKLRGLGGEIKDQFIEGMTGDYQGEQPNLREMMTGDYQGEEQAFLGGLLERYKENERQKKEYREQNPGGYPGQPENLRQRELEKENYPDLRQEPQEFSKEDVNRKVAELVGLAAMDIAEKNPQLAGRDDNYITDGTNGRMAQMIFERPKGKSFSDDDFVNLIKQLT